MVDINFKQKLCLKFYNKNSTIFGKYMIGYSLPSGNGCDIDISLLPN